MSVFGSIVTAMITPFDKNGNVDLAEAQRLAKWLVDRGNSGLVIAGSTGEGMTLDAAERNALIKAVKEAVIGRAAVVANVGTSDTRSTVTASKEAQAAGADALLVVVPPYNKPTQSGMIAHYAAVADAVTIPIMVYNIPGRTAANMLPETLLEIHKRHPRVCGVKESSGDLKQIGIILRDRPKTFTVLAGDDHLFLPCLALGADGVVGVASHVCSREYKTMMDAYRAGDVAIAAEIQLSLLALIDTLFQTTSPIAIKWVMNHLGFAAGECRLPLDGMPQELATKLKPLVEAYLATA
jgi:4-hydroxy-tetrahydrodipicolinate synthase